VKHIKPLSINILARDVPGFPGCRVTRDGRVFGKRGLELKRFIWGRGYFAVGSSEGSFFVHRAVALAWIDNPELKPQVNHIDGDKSNNTVGNLEWTTSVENNQHARDTGLNPNKERPVIGVSEFTHDGVWARSQRELNKLGYDHCEINKCLKGKRNRYKGFVWKYADAPHGRWKP